MQTLRSGSLSKYSRVFCFLHSLLSFSSIPYTFLFHSNEQIKPRRIQERISQHESSTLQTNPPIMLSTTSYILSNDIRATEFRRAVRDRVARRQEYAVPGSGASAQEVQRAYFGYCREQQQQQQLQNQGMCNSAEPDSAPYVPSLDDQAPPPSCITSTNDLALPPYTSTTSSEMTPTAQLDILLYSNASTPPSPPEYTEAIATPPPPRYQNVVCADTTPTSTNRTNQTPPPRAIMDLFAGCTTRTPRKQIHKQAIQAIELVVVPGNEDRLPPRPNEKRGILRRMKDRR